jgi:hypothetical protein
LPSFLSAHTSLSIPDLAAFHFHLTPFNSTPTSLCIMERPQGHNLPDAIGNRYCVNIACVAGRASEEDMLARERELKEAHRARTEREKKRTTATTATGDEDAFFSSSPSSSRARRDVMGDCVVTRINL